MVRPADQRRVIALLVAALQQAQLYMDAHDTSAPSRFKAETSERIEVALFSARESKRAARTPLTSWSH